VNTAMSTANFKAVLVAMRNRNGHASHLLFNALSFWLWRAAKVSASSFQTAGASR